MNVAQPPFVFRVQPPPSPQLPWLRAAVGGGWSRCVRQVRRLMERPFGHAAAAEPARNWHWPLRNELSALTGLNVQVQTLLTDAQPPRPDPATISAILLILDELLTNVIKYAHPGEAAGSRSFDLRIGLEADNVRIDIEDEGVPFDPTVDISRAAEEADLELEDRAIGGWGLSLVRKTASAMHYQRTGGRNQLTVYKRFPAA